MLRDRPLLALRLVQYLPTSSYLGIWMRAMTRNGGELRGYVGPIQQTGTHARGGNGKAYECYLEIQACDMCRKKKIKCDGKMPKCSHCLNYKTECIFTQVEKKRNPPKGCGIQSLPLLAITHC
jgi:hypothetical protein